jgi:predicted alpha/beta-fold hydrolase
VALTDRYLQLSPFLPPWWLSGAHRQTLAAGCWFGRLNHYQAVPRQIEFDDGDIVIVHDDCPPGWRPGDRAALLMHGLNGSHQSPVLVRLAAKLTQQGTRVFRWDMRGCGAGRGLARLPYHAGRSDDLARVLENIVCWCETHDATALRRNKIVHREPYLSLLGVSLSGNILLKYLGESPERIPREVLQAIAVNPPIDLSHSLGALRRTLTGWYDRHFVGKLFSDLLQRRSQRPDAPMPEQWNRPRSLMEFDDWYTAPVSGFSTSREYYDRSSAMQFMPRIQVPTTIITSQDDPMVPLQMFTRSIECWSPQVRLAVAAGGGHVGYIARRGQDPDEFWLDWRILELMSRHSHDLLAAA